MIPAMKPSAFDTLCRALVLGAVFGALGWGAVRYTNLPQIALKKIVALSRDIQGSPGGENYLPDAVVTSVTSSAPSLPSRSLQSAENTQADLERLPTTTLGVSQQQIQHPTKQAAYLEPTFTETNPTQPVDQTIGDRRVIEQRLCELGAVYSLLEMWGHENMQYRFHCRVSIANNRQVTRSFEANGASPEAAMRQVLKEVEGFQSASSLQGPDIR